MESGATMSSPAAASSSSTVPTRVTSHQPGRDRVKCDSEESYLGTVYSVYLYSALKRIVIVHGRQISNLRISLYAFSLQTSIYINMYI